MRKSLLQVTNVHVDTAHMTPCSQVGEDEDGDEEWFRFVHSQAQAKRAKQRNYLVVLNSPHKKS